MNEGDANLAAYLRYSAVARGGTVTEGDEGFGFQSPFPIRHPMVNGWFGNNPQRNGRAFWLWQHEPGPYGEPHELPALAAPTLDAADGSDIRRVTDRSTAAAFLKLVEASYESIPEGMADMITLPEEALLDDPVATWGLYEGDEMVSGVMTFTVDDVCGFYWAATRPDKRGRGYGTTVVKHAVGAANASLVVCQASREGLSVWERAGMKRTHTYFRYLVDG